MIIAITAKANTEEAMLEHRFGRAPWFCIHDTETQKNTWIKNEFEEAANGAGTKAAEKMAKLKVNRIISGEVGPKAKALLKKFNIQTTNYQHNMRIESILKNI